MFIKTLQAFVSYSHADTSLKTIISKSIENECKYVGMAISSDSDLKAGQEWKVEINKGQLHSAIQILLISNQYLVSPNCLEECNLAIEMFKTGKARIIPIILEECDWKNLPGISDLQVLPVSGGRVTPFCQYTDQAIILNQINKDIRTSIANFMLLVDRADIKKHKEIVEEFICNANLEGAKNKVLEFVRQFECSSELINQATQQAGLCASLSKQKLTPVQYINMTGKIYDKLLNIMDKAIEELAKKLVIHGN